MAPNTLLTLQQHYCKPHSPPFTSFLNSSKNSPNLIQCSNIITRRRIATTSIVSTILLVKETTIFDIQVASAGFDMRITVPDQTVEEAESTIKADAQDLLDVKVLIDSESWKQAQKALRKSAAHLKQDIYTMIQAKPGSERPLLRKLYSQLFNNVSRLDYAARSKDVALVREYYDSIVVFLDDILSRL